MKTWAIVVPPTLRQYQRTNGSTYSGFVRPDLMGLAEIAAGPTWIELVPIALSALLRVAEPLLNDGRLSSNATIEPGLSTAPSNQRYPPLT